MRLYRLLSRYGQVKQRLFPWFEPPAPEAPMRYDGWTWDPARKEWLKDVVSPIVLTVQTPRYPKPDFTPQRGLAKQVPGWKWSDMYECWERVPLTRREGTLGIKPVSMPKYVPVEARPEETPGWSWHKANKEWVATIVFGEPIRLDVPRSLPPGVDDAMILAAMPLEEQYVRFYEKMIALGLAPHEARRLQQIAGEYLVALMKAKHPQIARGEWMKMQYAIEAAAKVEFWEAAMPVILGLIATGIGVLIGTILDRLLTPKEEAIMYPARAGTYLLGPGGWTYSRHIGTSAAGRPFYSSCMGIGTEYARHKRGLGKGAIDIIDFPGGFLEEGYDFPYYVKFTWSYWTLQYVGMLYSCGADFYALKESDDDEAGICPAGKLLPASEWCLDFHHYL